jgi:hypothetical protein
MAISQHINGTSDSLLSHLISYHRSWLRAAVLIFTTLFVTTPPHAQEGRRLRAGYTSLSGNMLPLWAAREGG